MFDNDPERFVQRRVINARMICGSRGMPASLCASLPHICQNLSFAGIQLHLSTAFDHIDRNIVGFSVWRTNLPRFIALTDANKFDEPSHRHHTAFESSGFQKPSSYGLSRPFICVSWHPFFLERQTREACSKAVRNMLDEPLILLCRVQLVKIRAARPLVTAFS